MCPPALVLQYCFFYIILLFLLNLYSYYILFIKFCAAELMFGLVELKLELDLGQVTPIFFFAFLLVWLILGCIPKISFVLGLEVP